jgi:hypothetical protein
LDFNNSVLVSVIGRVSGGQELVEAVQVGRRHHNVADCRGLVGAIQRRRRGRGPTAADAQQDGFDVVAGFAAAHLNHPLHPVDGVVFQQLQDADEVLDAAVRAVLLLQSVAQFAKDRRQLPAAEDIGVIERRWLELQSFQIMLRIEDLLVFPVGTRVRRDDLAAQHHVDALDIGLDRHRLKSGGARHAVTVIVQAHHLILVDLGRLNDARIEARFGQRQGLLLLAGKALADRFGLAGLNTPAVTLATGAQVSVQFR